MGLLLVTLGNRFLSATGSLTVVFGYKRYGRPTLVTAGFLVIYSAFKNEKNIYATRDRIA